MAAAGAIAHDIYTEIWARRPTRSGAADVQDDRGRRRHRGHRPGHPGKGQNVAFLVGLAFAIAASANIRRCCARCSGRGRRRRASSLGIFAGLVLSILLIVICPTMMGAGAFFSLNNPGIVSIPLGFAVTIGVSLATSQKAPDEQKNIAIGIVIGFPFFIFIAMPGNRQIFLCPNASDW